MCRRLLPAFWLVAGLASVMFPTLAHAQVNIDQGKSPAEIYSADCATCHKTPRGLAAGKNSLMLSSFLREHYTASRDQAAALAAYVLGAGGAEPAPKQKPDTEHARAEEPKAGSPRLPAIRCGRRPSPTRRNGRKSKKPRARTIRKAKRAGKSPMKRRKRQAGKASLSRKTPPLLLAGLRRSRRRPPRAQLPMLPSR